jgi:hypothetical protein
MRWVLSLIAVVGILTVTGCTSNKTEVTPEVEPTMVSATADGLYSEFSRNSIGADAKYQGKILDVTGEVLSVNDPETLSGQDLREPGATAVYLSGLPKRVIWSTHCYYDPKQEPKMAELRAGDRVIIRGRYDGFIAHYSAIVLRECSLLGFVER